MTHSDTEAQGHPRRWLILWGILAGLALAAGVYAIVKGIAALT